MTLVLRRMRAHARIEGWSDQGRLASRRLRRGRRKADRIRRCRGYVVGRIYQEMIHGEHRWLWFLQTVPAPPPNQGMADTLEGAMAKFKRRYGEVKGTK
jgi:hypothetical protein